MIFIEKNKKRNIHNYIWFYDDVDKIKIIIGKNNNTDYDIEYIKKKDIYYVIHDENFKKKYSINYVDTILMKKLILEIKSI